jgi:hypothetical protein
MKKIVLIILVVCFGQHIFSQNESNSLSLGFFINPNIMYRAAWVKPGYEGYIDYKKNLKDDFPIFGYTYGFSLRWKRFQIGDLETGIYLSQRGYGFVSKIMVPDSIANFQYDPGFPYPDKFQVRDIFNFLDVQFLIKRNILEWKRIALYGKGGIALNVLLNGRRLTHIYYIDETEYDNQYDFKISELKEGNFRNVNFSALFSFGANISITRSIDIKVEAILNHFILPLWRGGDVAVRLFETGIKTGVSYKF